MANRNKKDIPNDNPLLQGNMEILDNPLLAEQSKELTISPSQEIEQKVQIITITETTNLKKQEIEAKKQLADLEIELNTINFVELASKAEVKMVQKLFDYADSVIIVTALDFKLYAEAVERVFNIIDKYRAKSGMNGNSASKHLKINRLFKNSDGSTRSSLSVHSDGDRMTIASSNGNMQEIIQVDSSDE